MRGLLLFAIWLAVALAIDAYGFDGQYRRVVVREANYQAHQFGQEVQHLLTVPMN
jgi:hypothetical protein